jgi:putative redox protein
MMAEPVHAKLQGSFLTELRMGKHSLVADEPVSAGGTDQGPTPYDLLASALASCTAMTMHFYAKREKLPLAGVELTVTHDRMHARDCADCVTGEGFIHRFNVEIRLQGDLSDAQKARLVEIAKRCPVAKTLQNEIKVYDMLS